MLFWWCSQKVFIACSCVVRDQEHTAVNASATLSSREGYQGRSPCLVSMVALIWRDAPDTRIWLKSAHSPMRLGSRPLSPDTNRKHPLGIQRQHLCEPYVVLPV